MMVGGGGTSVYVFLNIDISIQDVSKFVLIFEKSRILKKINNFRVILYELFQFFQFSLHLHHFTSTSRNLEKFQLCGKYSLVGGEMEVEIINNALTKQHSLSHLNLNTWTLPFITIQ